MDEEQEQHPECPIDLAYIKEQQDKCKDTQSLLNKDEFKTEIFHGGGKSYEMICRDCKIVIPKGLQ